MSLPDVRMSNRMYDHLKNTVTIYLPALATLYAALAGIWHWPYAVEVVGSITAICTFGGAVMRLSTKTYIKDTGSIPAAFQPPPTTGTKGHAEDSDASDI